MAKDYLGAEIGVGDMVVYVAGGRSTFRSVCEVVGIKTKIRVRVIKGDYGVNSEFWVDAKSCFAVKELKSGLTV